MNESAVPTRMRQERFDTLLTATLWVLVIALLAFSGYFGFTVWQNERAEASSTPALRAIQSLKQKVQQNPNDAGLRVNLAEALGVAGMYEEAVEQLEAALKIEPEHTVAYLDLGLIAIDQKKFDTAEKYLSEVIELTEGSQYENVNQTRELALYQLGMISLDKKQYEDAIGYFKGALRIRKDASDSYLQLAKAYKGVGEPGLAQEQLEIALAFDPNFAQAHYLMGQIYLEDEDKINAAVHLMRARELAPDVELAREALEQLGSADEWIQGARDSLEAGKLDRAVKDILTARALAPESAEAAKLHGEILEAKDAPKEALEVYREAAELDPDDAAIENAIERLSSKKS